MISVMDLLDYVRCKRRLWLSERAKIKKPNIGYVQGRRFHSVFHDIFEQIKSAWAREGIPGQVVETEVKLQYEGLEGKIDFLRRTVGGYVIHEEKYQEPPSEDVFPDHKLQLNAYVYLAENCGYAPVKSAYVIYNDLRPREIKPEPEVVPGFVKEVRLFIETMDALPARDEGVRCEVCSYYPLCQVLPLGGGIKENHLKILRQTEMDVKLIRELEESLKMKRIGPI